MNRSALKGGTVSTITASASSFVKSQVQDFGAVLIFLGIGAASRGDD